ncbi:MAG TPA: porin [Helicobacteraceae bacterium]|nr:porin [Helicobacteraceae bacterium]
MKLVKMSLAAAMLMGASAFAIENVKVSGDAKLFYSTNDSMDPSYTANDDAALFNKVSSAGQAALGLGVTADLTEGVSAGTHLTALTSLGLYNNLVANVWEGTPEDEFWFDEAWIAGTVGKTTGKIGRMELDTPLVFSESWSIAKNTFEAAVVINQDIPDTTLVAAYVGQTSGSMLSTKSGYAGVTSDFVGASANTNFQSFWNGAYAFGAVNNSWEPLTAQAWYYDAQQSVQAYWLQADFNMEGIVAGLQYTGISYVGGGLTGVAADTDGNAFAGKLGYEADSFGVSAAYSQTGEDAGAGFNLDGYAQSKLYTEAWWNYGYITGADTSAINVTATYSMKDIVDLGAYYTMTDQTDKAGDADMTELTLEVAKSFGPLDTGLYYIMTDAKDQNNGDASNTIQVYLTYNF